MADFLDFIEDDDDDESNEESENVMIKVQAERLPELLANRPVACGVLQFHNGIEESLLLTIERNSALTTAAAVVDAVDHFCYSRHWMMHVGPVKGKILDDVILQAQGNETKRIVCVELGSYCGYSTVRIASQFKHADSIVYSIEREATCCDWTRRLCDKAGVSGQVCVLEGGVQAGLQVLLALGVQVDVLFIDHDKVMYLNDLKLFEAAGVLRSPGAVVVADNVLSFGVPLADYLEHVRLPPAEGGHYSSSVLHRRSVEYSTTTDSVEDGSELEDGIEISYLL